MYVLSLLSLSLYLFLNTNRRRDIYVAGGGRHADLFREEEVVVQQSFLACSVLFFISPFSFHLNIHSFISRFQLQPVVFSSCTRVEFVILPLSLIWNSLVEYPKLQTIYCPICSLNTSKAQ